MLIQVGPLPYHSAAFLGNPDANNFDRALAASHDLALCRCKSAPHEIKQFKRESRKERGICTAMLACVSEHFQRKA